MQLVTPLRTPLTRWAERSQQRACRNAMVASTALAQARRERLDVEHYVVGALARREAPLPTQLRPLAPPVAALPPAALAADA